MFTGIIEMMGQIKEVSVAGSNKTFWLESSLANEFKVDQSVAHSGVCLTVEDVKDGRHKVTAVAETLSKTTLSAWTVGDYINLERSLLPTTRLDGHFVQGHVDATGTCKKIKDRAGSWEFTISFPKKFASLIVEKGSISVNGISLTAFSVKKNAFTVAVIPYTFEHTNLKYVPEGEEVNLEFDMLGKYILKNFLK